MAEKSHLLAHEFADSKRLIQVVYLADMFGEINFSNVSMQARNWTLVRLSENLKAFKEKLKLWMNKITAGKTTSFPSLNALLEDQNFSLTEVQNIIEEHMFKLISDFNNYIPENAYTVE